MLLKNVYSKINNPKELNEKVFFCSYSGYDPDAIYNAAKLYVPRGTKTAYQNTDGWKLFSSITEKDFSYELIYVVDGVVYKSYEIQAGMTVTPEGFLVKDGYVFSGWDTVPEIMPDHDVVVYGYFTPYTELSPMTVEEERSFSEDLTESMELSGVVINNVYYNVDDTDGSGYESVSGCIVLNTPMNDKQVDDMVGLDLSDANVHNGFHGIIFEVPAGSDKVTVDVQTLGSYTLNVKVGVQEPCRITQIERGKVMFCYTVSEPTLVYIYASSVPVTGAKSNVRTAAKANSVKLYGFKWERETSGIEAVEDSINTESHAVYTLTGVKVATDASDLNTLPRGMYIVNGKKVAVK